MAIVVAISVLGACGGSSETSTQNTAETPRATPPVEQVAAAPKTPEELGQKVYARCRTCHTLEDGGRHRVGPNLWGIFGKISGTAEGFAYSKAMKEAAITWDEESIAAYMENPKSYIPGNKMVFIGLRKQEDRDNLIAYLKAETQPK
ncbi:MAG: cytochrome c family protein [Acidimicrobiales bacterium]|nr:cytochrome c family protein [Hyphomonadaceae bacterium]RZV35310.1 MAG: cytochrome c family protein [Acidimicrobiales bacterium]